MHKQSGSFLLQALLTMSLLFVFIPLITNRLTSRDMNEKMSATVEQIDLAQSASRIYIRENFSELPYNQTVISGNNFADTLEPYGLPLGFVPITPFNQEIKLIINKDIENGVSGYLVIDGGNLNDIERAQIVRRIGFYAEQNDGVINVGIPLSNLYQDVVKRNEKYLEDSVFLIDLDMGTFSVNQVGSVVAKNGDFETVQFDTLSIVGNEVSRNSKNAISLISSDKTVFQSKNGESALSLTRGTLKAKTIYGKTVGKYGITGTFNSRIASVYDFSMTAGYNGFVGPSDWKVGGSLVSDRVSFSVERLDISSYLNVASGQDVYINSDSLEYSSNSGIETDYIYTSNITLRDQTSRALNSGTSGAIVVDIRPAGTSILPDVLSDEISNSELKIIKDINSDDTDYIDCNSIISSLNIGYSNNSLAQNIICRYVFWHRLEQRINKKECLMAGNNDC